MKLGARIQPKLPNCLEAGSEMAAVLKGDREPDSVGHTFKLQ